MKKNEFVEYVVLSNINLVFPSLDVTLCLYNSVALYEKKISLFSLKFSCIINYKYINAFYAFDVHVAFTVRVCVRSGTTGGGG